MNRAQRDVQLLGKRMNTIKFIFLKSSQNCGINVIESGSSSPILVQHTYSPIFENSNPLINTGNGVSIFVKGPKRFVMNFARIFSLAGKEFDDYALLDFRVHRIINVFQCSGGGNAFLRERQGRSVESGNGR
jgi:hypothetical protein